MERRSYKRLEMELPLYYRKLDSKGFFNSVSRNISEGGLGVILKEPESIERVLQFKLLMPKGHDIVDAIGRVVWLRKDANTQTAQAGIEIMDLGTDYRNRISALF